MGGDAHETSGSRPDRRTGGGDGLLLNPHQLGGWPFDDQGFDPETRSEGLAFAAQAVVALRSAGNEQHLRAAMASHKLIGQAQSVLMERFKVTAERAFTVLARASQDTNVELRDVAQRLIDTGESPGR